MKYQLKLVGQDLFSFYQQLTRRGWDVLKEHLYRNESCGDTPLCGLSEPIDPWVRHPIKGVVQFAGGP